MSEPIKVTISDPETGEILDEAVIDNDYVIVCAGNRYLDDITKYENTIVATIKKSSYSDDGDFEVRKDPNPKEANKCKQY
jgi:hypothetical protein